MARESLTPGERFWNRVDKTPGHGPNGDCWLWTGAVDTPGYGAVGWYGKKRNTHRVAYELANGPIDRNMDICHRCDVRLCCRPTHLFAASRLENVHDSIRKGRHTKGENCGSAKMSEPLVKLLILVHERLQMGSTEISRVTGINRHTIESVLNGKNWKHLT